MLVNRMLANQMLANQMHATDAVSALRICHLGKYYHPFRGGIETHVRSLALAQASLGHDVTVACINHCDSQNRDVWGSRTARTPTVSDMDGLVKIRRVGKIGTLARFDFCPGIVRFLKRELVDLDLIHLHVPNPVMCAALSAMRVKTPIVVTYHSDIVKQKWIRKPFRMVEAAVFRKVSRFIASSNNYMESSPILSMHRDQSQVIPFGIDLRPYQEPSQSAQHFARKLRSECGKGPIWLCVGRLVYYKGTEYAIRALKDCPGTLVIVGGGALETSLRALADSLRVDDRIQWRSNLSDDELIGAYHASTALWFPSILRSEAYGFVQIEAMASGCPVINTSIPGSGVDWVSLDNVSGLTVRPNDAQSFAAAARRLAEDSSVRDSLSAGSIHRANTEFGLMTMTHRTDALYRSVLGPRVARPSPAVFSSPSN